MATPLLRAVIAALFLLAMSQVASAQSVINPAYVNPYSRTSLSPYLSFSRGGDYDFRNPLVRPVMVVPDFLANFDPYRPFAGRPDFSMQPNSFEDWFKQRENETRFSPSGQPIGFMIYSPYYDLPHQNSFIPGAPTRGRYR